MKQKYQTVVDDLTVTREELSQERKTRASEQEEVESAKQELSNFKTRYREENRKMNEALQDKKHMFQELESEREKVSRYEHKDHSGFCLGLLGSACGIFLTCGLSGDTSGLCSRMSPPCIHTAAFPPLPPGFGYRVLIQLFIDNKSFLMN